MITRRRAAIPLGIGAFLVASIAGADVGDGGDPPPARPLEAAARPPLQVASAPPRTLLLAFHVDGGLLSVSGLPLGGYGRIGSEFFFTPRRSESGAVAGAWGAWEAWGAPPRSPLAKANGGLALPIVVFGGFETPLFFGRVGAGFNFFTIDHVAKVTGFGIFSPRAEVRLGFRIGAVEIGADANVQRRWQWKLDDLTALGAGLYFAMLIEEKM